MAFVVPLVASCLLALVTQAPLCQSAEAPECTGLNIYGEEGVSDKPIAGDRLPVCVTDDLQCCTKEFFEEQGATIRNELSAALREELGRHGSLFRFIGETLENYIDSDFIGSVFSLLPFPLDAFGGGNIILEWISRLFSNFIITDDSKDFSTRDFFFEIIKEIQDIAAEALGSTDEEKQCVIDTIDKHIDTAIIEEIAGYIEELRKAVTFFLRAINFYAQDFLQSLANYQPSEQCVNAYLGLVCKSCSRDIPPLCTNICGALVKGCYAPFRDGLQEQFEIFWGVMEQIVEAAGTTLCKLSNAEFNNILDVNLVALIGELNSECGVDITSLLGKRRRRQSDDSCDFQIPQSVIDDLKSIFGVFQYQPSGPLLCSRILTQSENCWDGSSTRDRDIEPFETEGIEGQGQNPAYSFNEAALRAQAKSLDQPVTDYFSQEETQALLPEGVTIPEPETGSAMATITTAATGTLVTIAMATLLSLTALVAL